MRKHFKTYKPLINKILWVIALGCVAGLIVTAVKFKQNAWVNNVVVEIEALEGSRNLLEKEEVLSALKSYLGFSLKRSQVRDLDLIELERLLDKDSKIKKAQVFIDAQDKLSIYIEQREPILRIIDQQRGSYYLDEEGVKVNPRKDVALRVIVATGHIPAYDRNFLKKKYHVIKDLYLLAYEINKDPFLKSLIEQIHVNPNEDLVLIPKIGSEKIVFGSATEIQDKLEKLKVFYKEGLTREGWGKYSHINLEIQGQVYATLKNP